MKLELVKELQGHKDGILCLDVFEDTLVSAGEDNAIKTRKLPELENLKTIEAHKGDVARVLFSPDKRSLLSCGNDGSVKTWNNPDFSPARVFAEHKSRVNALAFLDGENFISASDDQTLKLWNLKDSVSKRTVSPGIGDIKALAASKDRIAVGGSELRIYDRDMKLVKSCADYIYGVNFLDFSADLKFIFVSTSMEKTLEIWDAANLDLVKKMKNSTWVNHINFYKDRAVMAEGEYIKVLSKDFEPEAEIEAHSDEIYCIAVYKDFLVSAGNDKMLKLWKISD